MNKWTYILLIALTVWALPADATQGDSCENAIPLGKDYKATITKTGTVWYVANTLDLPLSVYFATAASNQAPEVEMDFTCTKGVYEDSILCSLFCPKSGSGGITVEMPYKPKLESKVLEDGRYCYYITMGKTYRDMLFQAGLDHDVNVYVKVTYNSTGDMSMAPDGMFANCMDGYKFMHIGDTIQVQANDQSRHVIIPYVQWQNDSIRYIWNGTKSITLATATECEYDPLDNSKSYIVDFFKDMQPVDTVKVTSKQMRHYVSGGEFTNEAGMFYAKWYSEGTGVLKVERVPMIPPSGNAILLQYDKSTPITPSDTTSTVYAISGSMTSSTQFVSHTDHVMKMWIGTSPDVTASTALASYTFASSDEGHVLNMDTLELDALWKKVSGNYLYLKIWCTASTSVTPRLWASSDCVNSKESLFVGTKNIARNATTVYKMHYCDWRGGDISVQTNKTSKTYVYIADTCNVLTSATDLHTVYSNVNITKAKPLTITDSIVETWSSKVDADGYLYWLIVPQYNAADITITPNVPEPVDPEPKKYPSLHVAVRCIGTPDADGVQQVEFRTDEELHLKLVDANGKRMSEWDSWTSATPVVIGLKSGSYQLIAGTQTLNITIP